MQNEKATLLPLQRPAGSARWPLEEGQYLAAERTDSPAPLTVAGHSHVVSYAPQFTTRDGRPRTATSPSHAHVSVLRGAWPRDARYWNRCLRAAEQGHVALSWAGNQHSASFLIAPTPEIDFVSSSRPDLGISPNAQVVAETALKAFFSPSFEGLRHLLGRAHSKGLSARIVVLGTPPPKADNERLRAYLKSARFFQRKSANLGISLESARISSPQLRLKLWHLLQAMAAEIAEEFSCLFCPSPASAQDEQGFLRETFWMDDPSHANEAYGKAMLDQLQGLLSLGNAP